MMVKRLLVSCEAPPPVTTIGISIPRLEDRKLLTGAGQYTADVAPAEPRMRCSSVRRMPTPGS